MKTAARHAKTKNARLRLVSKRQSSERISAAKNEVCSRELSPFQQEALILKYRMKARKLGRSILRRWNSRMDLEEVDSIVDLSLCEAVKRFDPEKGASFMTFLFYHLKGNLVRSVAAAAASSAIPSRLLEGGEGILIDHDSSTGRAGLNANEIAEAITSQDEPLPDEALWKKELSDQSSLACEKLDSLEREIIRRLFVQEQQIIDIAVALGYSRCHISRVKKKALDTLHAELSRVMNQDDCGLIGASSTAPVVSDVTRKEIHRRRPRAHLRRQDSVETARAA